MSRLISCPRCGGATDTGGYCIRRCAHWGSTSSGYDHQDPLHLINLLDMRDARIAELEAERGKLISSLVAMDEIAEENKRLLAENSLIDAAEAAQQTLHARIAELEKELSEYKAIWEACPECNSTMEPGPHPWESGESPLYE